MEVISWHKYLRISPKKIRELARLTVGLSPDIASTKLLFIGGKAPKLLSSVIKSAKANAVNNMKLNPGNLVIKEVVSSKGPFFKRWQPVSRGSAHAIQKRTTHLKVIVAEKNPTKLATITKEVKKSDEKIELQKNKQPQIAEKAQKTEVAKEAKK